jgi:hypothetical protein
MRSTLRIAHNVRLAAIVALGAFALHQLRYLLAFGSGTADLAEHGHRYMTDLLPAIAVLVLAGAVATLIRGTEGASPSGVPLTRRIAIFAGALLAIYLAQESLEAALSAGHPVVPVTLLGQGGWLALPLALFIGTLSAFLARALEGVERAIALVHAIRVRSRAPAVRGRALPARALRLAFAPLAFGLARRPPPPAPA